MPESCLLFYPEGQCLGHATVFPTRILKIGWDGLYYVNIVFFSECSFDVAELTKGKKLLINL